MSRRKRATECETPRGVGVTAIGSFLQSDGQLPATAGRFRVVGIDLGTTNSASAEITVDDTMAGSPRVRSIEVEQPTYEGVYTHTLVPSVVAIHDGKEIVGEGAKRLRARVAELRLRQNQSLFFDCKNDMGVRKTYHLAPEGYRSASEIAAKVLAFIHKAVLAESDVPITRTVVTVPASFQAAQREDTRNAARLAGIPMEDGDLLDEPLAAFLDFVFTLKPPLILEGRQAGNLVVFDFGGGTCDVAVFRREPAPSRAMLQMSPLAVSRYHRLGGGDIDLAIVHEVLLPQLVEQNGLGEFDLGYADKRDYVVPALVGIAERLKIGLCIEIDRLKQLGSYDRSDKTAISKTLPGIYPCGLPGRQLQIRSPRLTAAEFDALLEPFLDRDLLYARETEYRLTCSIFAPLQDALERASLAREDVHACLMVGGSSLIPQVVDAVRAFFPRAEVHKYGDRDATQLAVARGAAIHAFSLAVYGKPAIQPVCHDQISIRTSGGLLELVPKGAGLPYPSGRSEYVVRELLVPASSLAEPVELRVEIVAGDGEEERLQFCRTWSIPPPCHRGDPLHATARYDANQVLHLELRVANRKEVEPCRFTVDNPLTHVVNPGATRLRIEELEESIRSGQVPRDEIPARLTEVADLSADIGHHEKALELYGRILAARNSPDPFLLNKMALICGEIGDSEREEKLYREAAKHTAWNGPLFNLALAFRRRRRLEDALTTIDAAIARETDGPELTLKALILADLGDERGRDHSLAEALRLFGPVGTLKDWELGWYQTAAKLSGNTQGVAAADRELRRRRVKVVAGGDQGLLPDVRGDIRRVA